MRHVGRILVSIVMLSAVAHPAAAQESDPSERPVFRASVDLVSMAAVVRDSKGKVVSTLRRDDFEIIDGGTSRPILDLRSESAAPASVAILVDGSGSMNVGASAGRAMEIARQISSAVLASLNPARDDAALFSFDTRLIVLQDFTRDVDKVRARLDEVGAWGQTSLFDAIAGTAGIVSKRTANRRAVIVLTDGSDTASAYTPTEVSAIASSVDVPVYVFSLSTPIAADEKLTIQQNATLSDLARWTGGDLLDASTPAAMTQAISRLVEELRHQYVIAFEASRQGGWRSVQLKTRKRGMTVRTRAWYLAGSSE